MGITRTGHPAYAPSSTGRSMHEREDFHNKIISVFYCLADRNLQPLRCFVNLARRLAQATVAAFATLKVRNRL